VAASPTIVWFRRDLRVADHPALATAAARGPVVCLWIADPALLARRHHDAPGRRAFLRDGLVALDRELATLGVRLTVRSGAPAEVIRTIAAATDSHHVAWTREVSAWGAARDRTVRRALGEAGISVEEFGGDLIAEPEDVPGPAGVGYQTFAPFFSRWRDIPAPAFIPPPGRLVGPDLRPGSVGVLGDARAPLPAGPAAARESVVAFVREGHADRYADARDRVAENGTSRLSGYLRFGMCTAAQIGRALGLPGALGPGREAFWRQMAWREFYHHHLARNPEVAYRALRAPFRSIEWCDDPDGFAAWCAGRTGYPLVDAGMRQLVAEGWMHNRARMVCASFLVKDLLIDWRRGERVFMQRLIDADPASNNGGWQWTAGTGTDAAPYFRVFNPVLQSRKFDPSGRYIRRWVPELTAVPDRYIHEPWRMPSGVQHAAGCAIGTNYPPPIVDHAAQRARTLARYRAAESRGPGGI
jgi:deoxyribodipyrimidine photo-lyase